MELDGMEIIAIIVVIGLFVVVLKQFGIWEPLSLEGRTYRPSLEKFPVQQTPMSLNEY